MLRSLPDPFAIPGRRGAAVAIRELLPGITRVTLTTRPVRAFPSAHYRVDDALVDTGYPHVRALALAQHAGVPLRWIALTHHHEDHSGNAGVFAARHGCPVYLREAARQHTEGAERLPRYRRYYWGRAAPYTATEMPARLETAARTLRRVPTPGHSATHTALYDESTGTVFTGDLYVNAGVAAVMRHENPFASIRSLRRVAELEPALLLGGHGGRIEDPAERLRTKAQRIAEAAGQVLRRHRQGWGTAAIRRDVFHGDRWREWMFRGTTWGEFSEHNFVVAVIRHRDEGERG